jgi:hypothetical protein
VVFCHQTTDVDSDHPKRPRMPGDFPARIQAGTGNFHA